MTKQICQDKQYKNNYVAIFFFILQNIKTIIKQKKKKTFNIFPCLLFYKFIYVKIVGTQGKILTLKIFYLPNINGNHLMI